MYIRSPTEMALYVISRRKELRLTQTALGDLVGLKQKTISAFENKPENTRLSTVFQIASAVKLDIYSMPKEAEKDPGSVWDEEW